MGVIESIVLKLCIWFLFFLKEKNSTDTCSQIEPEASVCLEVIKTIIFLPKACDEIVYRTTFKSIGCSKSCCKFIVLLMPSDPERTNKVVLYLSDAPKFSSSFKTLFRICIHLFVNLPFLRTGNYPLMKKQGNVQTHCFVAGSFLKGTNFGYGQSILISRPLTTS